MTPRAPIKMRLHLVAAVCLMIVAGTAVMAAPVQGQTATTLLDALSKETASIVSTANPNCVTVVTIHHVSPFPAKNQNGKEDTGNDNSIAFWDYGLEMRTEGSGFLIPGGIVVTTASMAENVQNAFVIMPGFRRYAVDGVAYNQKANIGLMHISGTEQDQGFQWAVHDSIVPGEMAITIGEQGGFQDSAMLTMISATNRRAWVFGTDISYDNLIQFQGSLGTGSNGSPLIDTHGNIIGMVIGLTPDWLSQVNSIQEGSSSRDKSTKRDYKPINGHHNKHKVHGSSRKHTKSSHLFPVPPIGIPKSGADNAPLSATSFAIPISQIRKTVDALKNYLTPLPKPGWFGLRAKEKDGKLYITSVVVGESADKAGVNPGDIICSIDGHSLHSVYNLIALSFTLHAGEVIPIKLIHNGKVENLIMHIQPWLEDPNQKLLPVRK